ncbi:MAG: TRAP transporter small permease subunit [Paracoccaceae bacterium]|nr:TRAP transporter small permease subunit [Paracoccaceae bacterium]
MSTTDAERVSEADLAAGRPAPLTRIFGWANLTLMLAFILNSVLMFWFGWPGIGPLTSGAGGSTALAGMHVAIYAGALVLAIVLTLARDRSLRHEALIVSDANAFFIRAAFWAVLFVGLADTVISFVRVEGMLEGLVGPYLAVELGKSNFRGLWVHVPFAGLGVVFASFTRTLGFFWLALLVVAAELLIVFSRFIFSYEQAFMADLVRFWYAALFLFASAHTLLEDGHVRVDVIYAGFRRRARGRVNALGSVLLGMTLCWCILLLGMWTKSSIIVSPILVFETTQTGFGMYVKYFMAGFLGVFGISMMLQFVSYMFESVADWRDEPGGRPDHHSAHVG